MNCCMLIVRNVKCQLSLPITFPLSHGSPVTNVGNDNVTMSILEGYTNYTVVTLGSFLN